MLKVLVVKDPTTHQQFRGSSNCEFQVVTSNDELLEVVEHDHFDILLVDYKYPSSRISAMRDLFSRPIAIFVFNSGDKTIELHYLEYVADIIREIPKEGNQGDYMYQIWSQHFMRSLDRIQRAAESAAGLFAVKT